MRLTIRSILSNLKPDIQDRKGRAKQRRAATQPTFSTTVLASCYKATLLSWGQAALDKRLLPKHTP